MIACKFYLKGNAFCGFSFSGHSGYSEQGNDIVCAAVSSAAQFAICAISEVICNECETDMENGTIRCFISGNNKDKLQKCEVIFKTLEIFIEQLEKQYKEFIKVSKTEV